MQIIIGLLFRILSKLFEIIIKYLLTLRKEKDAKERILQRVREVRYEPDYKKRASLMRDLINNVSYL